MGEREPWEGERAAVFCTALVDSDPMRYQAWIDYYTDFFTGQNVDLYLYNDGPVESKLDLKRATLVTFPERLGRQDLWIFPGWKRSFSRAVSELGSRYRYLAHIESDTVVLKQGREEFLSALRRRGYRTGYTARHKFIETAVQVLNTPYVRRYFRHRYSDPAALHREEDFETMVQIALQPTLFLHGERIEGCVEDLDLCANYSYLSQVPIYQFLERYPTGEIPWRLPGESRRCIPRRQAELMRLRWALKHLSRLARGRG